MIKTSKINLLLIILLLGVGLVFATNETDLTCGDNFYSDFYCSDGNVYRDLHSFSDECIENISSELVEECEFGCENGICIEKSAPICDSDNLDLCITGGDCSGSGGYWYDDSCNAEHQLKTPSEIPLECKGCVLDGKCYYFNQRKADLYCSIETNKWENQKQLRKPCDDDYECKSNQCLDEECSKRGWFQSLIDIIFSWFTSD